MAAHANEIAMPLPLRWLLIPTVAGSLLAAAVVVLKRRAQRLSVAPMSDEWLRGHAQDRQSTY